MDYSTKLIKYLMVLLLDYRSKDQSGIKSGWQYTLVHYFGDHWQQCNVVGFP